VSNILAIDPGHQKCGVAVVNEEGIPLTQKVIAFEELRTTVEQLIAKYAVECIVLGDRTHSKVYRKILRDFQLPIEMVNEDRSSIEGRMRYLRENSRGLKRLLPLGLRTPDRPYDDYVAVILAERYLAKRKHR